MTREQLAETIALRIDSKSSELREQWRTAKPFGCFVLDELLPPAIAHEIHSNLPSFETLMLRSTIRERKRVGVDVQGHPLAHAALYAFQDDPVVRAVERVTGISQLQADPTLYASGVSAMAEGDFLNPHLDNSHDGNQSVYRVLNLLYYVTPGWQPRNGGNLELWDRRGRQPVEITATFNRLVVMATHQTSWHSVNQVKVPGVRWCLSNYYFSPQPPGEVPFRHVTTFRGRPEQPIRGLMLRGDGMLRQTVGTLFPSLLKRTKHRLPVPTKTR